MIRVLRWSTLAGVVVVALGLVAAPAAMGEAEDGAITTASPEQRKITEESADTAEPRVIELYLDISLLIKDADGDRVQDIAVTPGETVRFRIHNTAPEPGIGHNFYIGEEDELTLRPYMSEIGIPAWTDGVRELLWVVPDQPDDLLFGCTVFAHWHVMQGTISAAGPAGA